MIRDCMVGDVSVVRDQSRDRKFAIRAIKFLLLIITIVTNS